MQRLVFIDDDKKELDAFHSIVQGWYDYTTIHWPGESAKLFNLVRPDIVVSDLYLPSSGGDAAPSPAQREEAAEQAKRIAERFSDLYPNPALDDKARLQKTMQAISDAYAMLKLQG